MKYLHGLLALIFSLCSVASIFLYIYVLMFTNIGGWAWITLFSYLMAGATALFILVAIICLERIHEGSNKRIQHTKHRL